jgi:regulator of protease activity HflC (stomatin/prohibitin superfamily)
MVFKNKWTIGGAIIAGLLTIWLIIALINSGLMGIILAVAILTVIATATSVAIENFGVIWFFTWLAEHDVWWSPYRMRPGPGHFIMMTKGKEPGGPFDQVITGHIPYWHYHEGDRRFYKESDSPIKSDPPFKKKFPGGPPKGNDRLEKAGIVKVGLFRRFYKRKRRWDAWDLRKDKPTEYGLVHKETKPEEEHIFYFSTTMAVDLETIPTKDNYPAQIKLVFNVLNIHPERAEFLAGKWETQAVAAVKARAREYIARMPVAELRKERDTDKTDDFMDHILFANQGNPEAKETGTIKLLPEYGVLIQGPQYVDFDLESGDKEMTDAMKRQMIASEDEKTAEILKRKIRIDAEAEKEKRKIEAEGTRDARKAEAEGIRAEYAARMSVKEGAALSMAEAIRVSQPRYISLGADGRGGIMIGVDADKPDSKPDDKPQDPGKPPGPDKPEKPRGPKKPK